MNFLVFGREDINHIPDSEHSMGRIGIDLNHLNDNSLVDMVQCLDGQRRNPGGLVIAINVNGFLQENPDDAKAFHCKIVCLIHLSKFDIAIKTIEKNSKLSESLNFEKAYCLYRLNKIKEAWALLKDEKDASFKIKELTAQVLYRLEKYEKCFEAYKELVKNSEDDFEEERETNLAAVIASLSEKTGKEVKNPPQLREHTYELCYNKACILVGEKMFGDALEKLKKAENLCRQALEEDEVPEEEIEDEVGIIVTQMSYCLQQQGKSEQALKQYNCILKQRPTDMSVAAVASNNIVTLNKDQNVFDSKKKIKIATGDGLESKMTNMQRKAIALNHCLLLYHTNQSDLCRKQLDKLAKSFPESSSDVILLQAAIYSREKQVPKAIELLKGFAASNPAESLHVSFVLVQLLLTQGHVNEACDILKSLDVSHKPGIVSALVTLYLNLEDKDSASKVLQDAINWYKENQPKSSNLGVLLQEGSKFYLRNNQMQKAAELLEDLRQSNPRDPRTLAQLISAYSQFNPSKAREISRDLPPVGDMSEAIDVNFLETASWSMGAKYVKKGGKTEVSPSAQSNDTVIKKRHKKKKKGKLPKNYDPNVDPDPERWLPRRERSTYKKRKDRRGAGGGIGKGTQGAVGGAGEIDVSKINASPRPGSVTTSPAGGAMTSPQGPRQQRPQPAQKKKKKGGRR
ncbi:signal recognition particle subunit SRP72-like [Limulus polyphemus]|uniref:Signal recognition particle subunit SRP72 n=1 Tax=Limulus polyphemus TaxID=6850 RepID=A0ABM1T2E3_LIMPO|nr:signal recognition particle subunit SRP72-like [Limulus polyphemus]